MFDRSSMSVKKNHGGEIQAMRAWRLIVLLTVLAVASCAGLNPEPVGYDYVLVLFNEPNLARLARARGRPAASKRAATPQDPIEHSAVTVGDAPRGCRRAQTLATAARLMGFKSAFDAEGFLHHILEAGAVRLEGVGARPSIRDVFRALQASRRTYDRNDPVPGDLVFFHNTHESQGGGSGNHWYSLVGVVETVASSGTITVIVPWRGEVVRRSMNLGQPEVWRVASDGPVLNDVLREKKLGDSPNNQYLAGELYAGFAALPDG